MKKGFFNRVMTDHMDVDESSTTKKNICIQVLTDTDIKNTKSMPAGADEDQSQRLKNMTHFVKQNSPIPIETARKALLPPGWLNLLKAIDQGQFDQAKICLKEIPNDDTLKRTLHSVHTEAYLLQIIKNCILAKKTGVKKLNSDVIITPKTFEILIKDCAATMMNRSRMIFSFGLPSHHAYSDFGSGFCILNKTAMLIKKLELETTSPLQYLVIGTDVNRDNGLCDVLRTLFSHLPIRHIDIFDSRVYPQQDHEDISNEFDHRAQPIQQQIMQWSFEGYEYVMVDLNLTRKEKEYIHPALAFAVEQLKEKVAIAKQTGHKIALLLPTGWDSHKDETALCGKFVNGHFMSKAESETCRFSDDDLTYFYQQVFQSYHENPDCFAFVYWGLEGGYDSGMYQKEIELLMQLIRNEFEPNASNFVKLIQ